MTIFESRRNWLLGGAAGFALVIGGAGPAFAQDAAAPGETANAQASADTASSPTDTASEGDAIVVTGFRAALQSAVATKRRNEQIVESISAEDIGRLPDQSIAESIARLPGLAAQRIAGSGRTSFISIRGLGPDFSTTTLNGRLQTSTSDVRSVEYDQYPSEIVSGVDIYKTMNARLIGQGLVGSIDIRTIRPLDYSRQLLSVGIRGIYTDTGDLNPDSNSHGYRVNAAYVTQFANDRAGLALSASYANEPYQVTEERSWGWPGAGTDSDPHIIGGLATWNNSTEVERLGLTGTFQFDVSDQLRLTIDGFYSRFQDNQVRRGVELPLQWGGATLSGGNVENGIVTEGTFSNVPAVVNNHNFRRQADLYSFGGNLRYQNDSGWTAFLDVGWSRTDRVESNLETNAGTGPGGNGANDIVDFALDGDRILITDHSIDYSDPTQIFITDPNGWGGGAPNGRQHGYLNNRTVDDEILQFSGELAYEVDAGLISALRFGANHVMRDKSLTPDEYYLELSGGALQAAVPSEFILSPINNWVGLGPVLTYDARGLLNSGFFNPLANTTEGVRAKAFALSEDVTGIFAMADVEQEFGGATLTGNFGILGQRTEQVSNGFRVTAATGIEPFSDGDTYWDILPSANLNLRFDNGFVIRAAAARQLMRPRMDDMAANFSYGFDQTRGIISGTSGNPRLRPYRATSLDLTFERYWENRGYIALQLFWKNLDSIIYRQTVDYDWSGFPLPNPDITDTMGEITTPINGEGGRLYGAELAGTLPFEVFTPALEGFGATGGVSYTVPKVRPDANSPAEDIPGYSRWVVNGTLFFERSGFSARASARYRSSYQGDFSDFNATRVRRRVQSETVVDAQIGYDFQEGSSLEGLSLFLQGINLTDEPMVSHEGMNSDLTLDYQRYGRRFMAGASYRF